MNIRKTAARYALRTEAAIRFEKALDPALCEAAIIRSFDLIKRSSRRPRPPAALSTRIP